MQSFDVHVFFTWGGCGLSGKVKERMKLGKRKVGLVRQAGFLVILLLAFVVVFLPFFGLAAPAHADTASSDVVTKQVAPNGDGTYSLTLSATGRSSSDTSTTAASADIVLVIDRSGSMDEYCRYQKMSPAPTMDQTIVYGYVRRGGIFGSWSYTRLYYDTSEQIWYYYLSGSRYRYSSNAFYSRGSGGYQRMAAAPAMDQRRIFGMVNGEYVQLYYDTRVMRWYYASGQTTNWYDGSDFYEGAATRMETAQSSAKSLVDSLTGIGDKVRVSVVSFSDTASIDQGLTSDDTALKEAISGITPKGGTNWEDGLAKAQDALSGSTAENKYVIFLSDGNPTFRNTALTDYPPYDVPDDDINRTYYNQYGIYGTGNSDNYGRNFDAANTAAQALRRSGVKLYTSNVFGEASKMSDLSNDGSYHVADESELHKALDKIFRQIVNSMAVRNITVHDKLTSLTDSSVTKTVKGLANAGSDEAFVYKATDSSGRDVTGSYAIPKAAINAQKEISWTPGDVPLDVTYSVSCIIWPSTKAYAQVAKKMNGEDVGLDANISGNNTDGYKLATNEESQAAYDEIHTTTQPQPTDGIPDLVKSGDDYSYHGVTFTRESDTSYAASDGSTLKRGTDGQWTLCLKKEQNPLGQGEMDITPAKVNITKTWKNDGTRPDSITVQASADDAEEDGLFSTSLTGSADENTWQGTLYVAPGLTSTKLVDGSSVDLNQAAEYRIEETGMDASEYQVSYTGDTCITPAVTNGTVNGPFQVGITNTKIVRTGLAADSSRLFATVIGIAAAALSILLVMKRRFARR